MNNQYSQRWLYNNGGCLCNYSWTWITMDIVIVASLHSDYIRHSYEYTRIISAAYTSTHTVATGGWFTRKHGRKVSMSIMQTRSTFDNRIHKSSNQETHEGVRGYENPYFMSNTIESHWYRLQRSHCKYIPTERNLCNHWTITKNRF